MPIWIAIILLGIIEGITEFLPISSTGHLLISECWLPRQTDLFNVVIQCGAVLAVLPLFPHRLRQFAFEWRSKPTQDYALKILLAFVLTGIGGLAWDRMGHHLPKALPPVAWALLIGGIGFVVVEQWLRGRTLKNEVTWSIAVAVGFAQLIAAIFPGTSRSGASILFCLMLGLNRPAATEFSFLVGIPTMLAAGGLEIFKALRHHNPASPPEQWSMVVLGFIVAAAVSFIAVGWLLRYIQTHTFVAFGWYRIGLAALIALLLHLGCATHKDQPLPASPVPPASGSLAPSTPAGRLQLTFELRPQSAPICVIRGLTEGCQNAINKRYTSQISIACRSEARASGRFGTNSWPTNPL